MIRRQPLKSRAIACLMVGLIALAASWAAAQDDFDWRQFEGATLRVLFSQHPMSEAMMAKFGDFTALTGINVEVETFAEEQHRLRRATEFLGGNSTIDVYNCQITQEGEQYASAGWVHPIEQYLSNPRLTSPTYDFADFGSGAIDKGRTADGTLYGLPFALTSTVFFYRLDIFEELGLEVPRTWAEVEAAAQTVFEATNGEVYGIVLRGTGTSVYAPILFAFGGTWEVDGRPALDSPEAIASAELYGRLLRNWGPPGAVNHGWFETTTLFSEGRAAMKLDSSAFIPLFEDPASSRVAGLVGYATAPAGPTGIQISRIGGWEICISGQSQQPEVAWYFLQYMTSAAAAAEYLAQSQLDLGRASAWSDPAVIAAIGQPQWGEVLAYNTANGIDTKTAPPSIVTTREAEAAIAQMIQASILGQNTAAAARQTQQELEDILAREREN